MRWRRAHLLADVAAWVVPSTARPLVPGMFVSRVTGASMEPLIPDGSYCVFAGISGRPADGTVVLAELGGVRDPETGASYTVKRVRFEERRVDGRAVRTALLVSENPRCAPIRARVAPAGSRGRVVRFVARFVEVLG